MTAAANIGYELDLLLKKVQELQKNKEFIERLNEDAKQSLDKMGSLLNEACVHFPNGSLPQR